MKKLNITKEQFNRSNYFQRKYGKLEYVSESGKLFKTRKGHVIKFVNEGRGLKFMDDMVAARKAAGQDYDTRMSRGREAYDAKLNQDIPGDFDLKTKEEIKTLLPSMRRAGFTLEDIVDAYENGVRPNKCERKNGALYIGGMDGYFVDVDEYISLLSDSKKVNESTSGDTVYLNVERFRQEITEILQEEADSWDDETGSMKYNAEEYLEQYVDGIVDDTIESFNELVHSDDTSMTGNFADIRYDWEGFHNELPHGCTLKEVVEMIDAGEENEVTKEFKDWTVDWYFRAFGTYGLKYNWTDFISELAYNDDEEAKRWNDQED